MSWFGSLGSSSNSTRRPRSSTARDVNVRRFLDIVRKGDILITELGIGGLIGHAAIMISDSWVLEMEGGDGWQNGIPDNNRRIKKSDWYDFYGSEGVSVYRNRDDDVAELAAEWAIRNYYNSSGGSQKTKHIRYFLLAGEFSTTNPSYCSKLVLQAYYFGTGDRKVVRNMSFLDAFIVPSEIPKYFLKPYTLEYKGTF